MSDSGILFAAGPKGTMFWAGVGARILPVSMPVDLSPARGESEQRAIIDAALAKPESGMSLHELAKDKRRVVILAGDLSRPAPYDIALPVIVKALVGAGIRPSRIAVFACPGGGGQLLGRAAIHRYGEEVCGEHEVQAWPESGSPGAMFDSADLKIAVGSHTPRESFCAFLPPSVEADFALELTLGKRAVIDVESARAFDPKIPVDKKAIAVSSETQTSDVLMTTGGGAPWEETLEEALLGLHASRVNARTAVLIFSGAEGLGSARFTWDVWSLIEQAEAFLASGGVLKNSTGAERFDPAGTLAAVLSQYKNVVLLAPELAAHGDGEELLERLEAAPHVAGKLALCASHAELWSALSMLHGAEYSVIARPLGWRAF